MIINYSEKEGKKGLIKGFFINEGKDNVKVSKTGKSFSFLVTETAIIIVKKGDVEKKITGKELLNMIFA